MGRFDHGAMACIMPFKGTYSLLREYGARKARLALGRAVAVVHFITGATADTVYIHVLGQVATLRGS
jgi:hypothetical protein